MSPTNPNEDTQCPPNAQLPIQGRLGGVDFGTVRIGVAISDPGQSIASPLLTYQRRTIELDAKFFQQLAKDERLVGWVVGLPVHMSGDASQKSKEAISFGQWLEEQTEVAVAWIDERYTTAMARELLNATGLSGKKRKAQLDKLAAQILLTAFLERPREATGARFVGLNKVGKTESSVEKLFGTTVQGFRESVRSLLDLRKI